MQYKVATFSRHTLLSPVTLINLRNVKILVKFGNELMSFLNFTIISTFDNFNCLIMSNPGLLSKNESCLVRPRCIILFYCAVFIADNKSEILRIKKNNA